MRRPGRLDGAEERSESVARRAESPRFLPAQRGRWAHPDPLGGGEELSLCPGRLGLLPGQRERESREA
eukprot:9645701-Prorocentrum_lima.AAC.1